MEAPQTPNFVNTKKQSAKDEFYTFQLRMAKLEALKNSNAPGAAEDAKTLAQPGLLDQIETSILAKLYGMSDLSPELSWTLSMCEASTREEAAKKLAQKVVSQKMTENLTKSLTTTADVDGRLKLAGVSKVNAFGV